MASKGDKLSPIFKSLRPDESHLESVAASAVQDAELRWPLFRAIAPTKSAPAPELTAEDRANWTSPKATRATPQHKLALTVPGLSEQLAEGLHKMAGNKAPPRKAKAKTKTAASTTAVLDSRSASVQKTPLEMQRSVKPALSRMAPVTTEPTEFVEGESVVEPQNLPPTATIQTMQPEPRAEAPALAPVVKPTIKKPKPAPLAEPTAVVAPASPVPPPAPAMPKSSPKPAPVSQPAAAPKLPQLTPKAPNAVTAPIAADTKPASKPTKPAARTEPLKNLFSRLETPEPPPPPPKPAVKKPSFLGRLGKR